MTDRPKTPQHLLSDAGCPPTKTTPAARRRKPSARDLDELAVTKTRAADPAGKPDESSALERLPVQFGRYRLIRELGRGGMGAVVLAEDTQLARQVALKIPFLSKASDRRTIKRFEREAKAAASLCHPNLCAVYDFGTFKNHPFLSMAYIPGKPLEAYLNSKTPIPQRTAAGIVKKIAQALEHAHERGVIHRDLKPSNVMIEPNLGPIVTDFGLARCLDEDGDSPLTQDGVAIGTPSYMSPEQLDGDFAQMGPQSDIFSLGLILYEMLTGQRRFQGKVASIIGQILTKDPASLREIRSDVDPQLDLICQKMMARDPVDRYASMAEVADVMRAYLKGELHTRTDLSSSDPDVFFLGLPAGNEPHSSPPSTQSGAGFRTQAELIPPLVIEEDVSTASRILKHRAKSKRWSLITALACFLAAALAFVVFYVISSLTNLETNAADVALAAEVPPDLPVPPTAEPISAPPRKAEHRPAIAEPRPPGDPNAAPIPWRVEKVLSDLGTPDEADRPAADPVLPTPVLPMMATARPEARAVKLKSAQGKLEFHALIQRAAGREKKVTSPRTLRSELALLERRQTASAPAFENLRVLVVVNGNIFEFREPKPVRDLAAALEEAFPHSVQIEEVLAKLEYLSPEMAEPPAATYSALEQDRLTREIQALYAKRLQQLRRHLYAVRVARPEEEIDKAQAFFEQECRKTLAVPKRYPLPRFSVGIPSLGFGPPRIYVGDAERYKEQSPRGQVIRRIAEALNAGTLLETTGEGLSPAN